MDYVGNTGRHKIVNSFDALGGKMNYDAVQKAIKNCIKDGKPKSVLKAMSNAEKQVEQERRDAAEKARQEEEARRANLVPKSNELNKPVLAS